MICTSFYGWEFSTDSSCVFSIDSLTPVHSNINFGLYLIDTYSSLVDSACNTYQSPSGLPYFSSGTYNDTISNTSGADSIITINLTVTTINTSITQTWDTFESNNIGSSYQWINCSTSSIINDETNQSFTPTVNGNYAVQLTENGCIDTSACYLINSVGLLESNFDNNLIIYPNPTDGLLKIELAKIFTEISVQIIDINGKIILNKTGVNSI